MQKVCAHWYPNTETNSTTFNIYIYWHCNLAFGHGIIGETFKWWACRSATFAMNTGTKHVKSTDVDLHIMPPPLIMQSQRTQVMQRFTISPSYPSGSPTLWKGSSLAIPPTNTEQLCSLEPTAKPKGTAVARFDHTVETSTVKLFGEAMNNLEIWCGSGLPLIDNIQIRMMIKSTVLHSITYISCLHKFSSCLLLLLCFLFIAIPRRMQ